MIYLLHISFLDFIYILFSASLSILYLPFDKILRSNSVSCFMYVQESIMKESGAPS